jgi:glycosyltransferase involved in cell wall biosynthesis
MWETTLVPRMLVEGINRNVTLLYVPCRQNAESFRERGVRIPIKVLHHGVDSASFPLLERPQREVFTFGTFGVLSARKGVDALIRAFRAEFGPAEPVRLILKSSGPFASPPSDDPRIEVVTEFVDQAGLLELLRRMDAFVLPSRGEGFGLCGLEAMATGLPLIATNWSGPTEYLDPADSFPLAYHLVEAEGFQPDDSRSFGFWAEPDHDHLRHVLRWLFEHPAEAATRGRQAAARARRDWSWDRVACQLRQDCDAVAAGATPAGSWTA